MNTRKTVLLCPDGAADYPAAELHGRTPLEAAALPRLAAAAQAGTVGLTAHAPANMEPGSDVCIMSLLGCDPAEHHTGRAPLEAPALGVELADDEVAVRCNLVTVENGLLTDFTAGHITTEEAAALTAALNRELGGDDRHFHCGISYRHLLVLKTAPASFTAETDPPHDIVGESIAAHLPQGNEAAALLRDLMARSRRVLASHPINLARRERGLRAATQVWLWGHGPRPALPPFGEILGNKKATGTVVGAVALIKSLGLYLGLDAPVIPGATGFTDTDYAAKGHAALEALQTRDFVFTHVEAPDEAGHQGDVKGKVEALEKIDRLIVGPLLESPLARAGKLRLLVCPDHPTPCAVKTHVKDPVPFLAWGPNIPAAGRPFTEAAAVEESAPFIRPGHTLLPRFISGDLRG